MKSFRDILEEKIRIRTSNGKVATPTGSYEPSTLNVEIPWIHQIPRQNTMHFGPSVRDIYGVPPKKTIQNQPTEPQRPEIDTEPLFQIENFDFQTQLALDMFFRMGQLPTPSEFTEGQIKKIFRKLAKRHHPDLHFQGTQTERKGHETRFREVQELYKIIVDQCHVHGKNLDSSGKAA
ncbi:MAG: DnaJ domain-containing protein [Bdellovibrionales bacterium]